MAEERREGVRVNGAERPLTAATVAELLAELGYATSAAGIAVAVNGEVVPRASWGGRALFGGDVVEVVGAVQGG